MPPDKKSRPDRGARQAFLPATLVAGLTISGLAVSGAHAQEMILRGSIDAADPVLVMDETPPRTDTPSPNRPAETDDTTTGALRATADEPAESEPLDPAAQRVQPIERRGRATENNPYEAVGIRLGSFILKPSLEVGVTATTNADSSVDGTDAVLSETSLRLNATSDWSIHRASIDAHGTFRKTLSGQEVEDFTGGLDAELELELGHEYRARGTLTYSTAPESASSPVSIVGALDEPIRQTVGGTLGLEKHAGKARFAITGGVSHDAYGDADIAGGGVVSQKDRDTTLYSLTLRGGYEISPALTPFVEVEIGRNQYDRTMDSAGYERSSDRQAIRGGLALDFREKLSAEFAAGWIREEFDDSRLSALTAPSLRGRVMWSPERGTNVFLNGSSTLESTTTPGESGSVLYSTSISVERQIRANLTGSATLGASYRNYAGSDGHDVIWNAEASLTWWLNRYAGLVGRVRHEDVSSNLSGRDSETSSIFLGLKLQR